MSLFNWLFPARSPKALADKDAAGGNGQSASRKNERMARRELLYAVVRESMTRAGVLSASYKFKVLSLDPRGSQFLVMVDLARTSGAETARLAEIEARVAQAAKTRHDIIVTAMYWRTAEHVAVGGAALLSQKAGTDSQPAPLDSQPGALASRPAPLDSPPSPGAAAARRTSSPYEPIQADEVVAFKRALAAGVLHPAAVAAAAAGVSHGASAKSFDGSGRHGPQSYTLLTGFEDTEMPDADRRTAALSGTQYGDLT
jgi:hypothetical protein